MTSAALSFGCAFIAFAPALSLLLLLTYAKAQLVIIVTTAAFAQLLACLVAALAHLPFTAINIGRDTVFLIIPISVASQAFCRCGFVWLYHRVETVIEQSIRRHELETTSNETTSGSGGEAEPQQQLSETARLRLELNDMSCALAAGIGFGGMHTVMLYGTLLASETNRKGTLYQPSCSFMPSLVNSAIMACFFSMLDIVWMMMTFYGMRRVKGSLFGVSFGMDNNNGGDDDDNQLPGPWSVKKGAMGGKASLAAVVITHLAAAFATVPNRTFAEDGCVVALPTLAAVTALTMGMFWFFCKDNYLPHGQRERIRQATSVSNFR